MKKVFLFLGCFWASLALAQGQKQISSQASPASAAIEAPRALHAVVAWGQEYRPEQDVNNDSAVHTLGNFAIGVGYENFLGFLERATFSESSGNPTLNVSRHLEDWMFWGEWRALSWHYLVPFMGVGLGAYQEKVDSSFNGASVSNQTSNKLLGGGNLGLSLDLPYLWISFEMRLLMGDELPRQPLLDGLARVGLDF